jgi:acyl-ACP thioesterase
VIRDLRERLLVDSDLQVIKFQFAAINDSRKKGEESFWVLVEREERERLVIKKDFIITERVEKVS